MFGLLFLSTSDRVESAVAADDVNDAGDFVGRCVSLVSELLKSRVSNFIRSEFQYWWDVVLKARSLANGKRWRDGHLRTTNNQQQQIYHSWSADPIEYLLCSLKCTVY